MVGESSKTACDGGQGPHCVGLWVNNCKEAAAVAEACIVGCAAYDLQLRDFDWFLANGRAPGALKQQQRAKVHKGCNQYVG